jgi:hypothetical protein
MYPHTNNAHFTYVNVKECFGEGKRPLARPRRRWEDNINTGASRSEMWGFGLDRSRYDRDRRRALVNAGSIKCGEFLD